jgi:hypothetical protein
VWGVPVVDNEWMPTAAVIDAQLGEFGIRTVGTRDIARRLADQLAEDEQVADMVKAFVLKRDAKNISGGVFILLALTDRRLVICVRLQHLQGTMGVFRFTAMLLDELSDLSALDRGRFQWTFEGHRWTFDVQNQAVFRTKTIQANTNRFYASLKSRFPT